MLPDETPGGYDIAYSAGVDPDRDGSDISRLPARHWFDWVEAREALLKNPTTDNPSVTDASHIPPYHIHDHVMIKNQLAIVYRFLNFKVIEILSVDVRPSLPSGHAAPPDAPPDRDGA